MVRICSWLPRHVHITVAASLMYMCVCVQLHVCIGTARPLNILELVSRHCVFLASLHPARSFAMEAAFRSIAGETDGALWIGPTISMVREFLNWEDAVVTRCDVEEAYALLEWADG